MTLVSPASDLKSQLNALVQIQEIDLQMDRLKKNKGILPASLQALDTQIAQAQGRVALKKAAIETHQKSVRQSQAALELTVERLAKSTIRLESVKNSQEYQATQKELDQLKKQEVSLREALDKFAKEKDQFQSELDHIQSGLTQLQTERETQAASLVGESGKLEEQLSQLLSEREKFSPLVERKMLLQYDRVRNARAGVGITPAVSGRCKSCNMIVPPQQYNELQKGTVAHSCPSCHRILFIPQA